ncbi:MAG: toll/interleukin-1 receptor domain-containing protein [Vitreimonas sp.]
MSNGYIVAADADIAAAREIAEGLNLEVIDAGAVTDHAAVTAALARAPSVAVVLSAAAAENVNFAALLRTLAGELASAQLIAIAPEARAAFDYVPQAWPTMSLEEALERARRHAQEHEAGEQPAAPRDEPAPETTQEAPVAAGTPEDTAPTRAITESGAPGAAAPEQAPPAPPQPRPVAPPQAQPSPPPSLGTGATLEESDAAPTAPPQAERLRATAPADATAFAPRKLRRGTPELVRIAIHQPKDLAEVIKAARKIDPRAEPAPSGMRIGEVPLGSSVGVSLDVRGGACNGALQRRTWAGEPLDFSFSAEGDADVKQAVFLARVFVDDAQIGVLAFTRPVAGPAKKAADLGGKVRLKRHKRVFLSYSSQDRASVSAIATAYAAAGVEHFFDRTSLKSGEEWGPRLRREIERADLFHLCWSKSAAASEWVENEAEYALARRHRSSGRRPDITVQMLDGPPWAPHPRHLDAINFDDFVRAAIVGYARGDGS